jgi:RAB protein geranylgeranyltransferase component A
MNELIDMLTAVGNREYLNFQELENTFVAQHGE